MSDANLEVLIQIREELAGLNRTREQLKGAKDDANSLKTVLMQGLGIGGGMALATGAVALLKNTLVGTVREAFAFAGRTKDMSEALGISATKLQVLRLEFEKAGLDIGRLNMAIATQTQSLADARDVSSSAAQAYRQLGLDAAKVEALPIEQRLLAVTRAMDQAADKTLAFQAASQILGARGLPQLLNAMRDLGAQGVDAMEKLYVQQGLIMSDDEMERLDRAGKQWQKFWNGMVIGSGSALAWLDRFIDSAQKAPGDTLRALLAAGTGGLYGIDRLKAVVNQNAPIAPSAPSVSAPAPVGSTINSEQQKREMDEAKRLAAATLAARDAFAAAARDHADALKREGEAVRLSVRTPLEEYGDTVSRLNQLHTQGVIDAATFARAVKAAAADLQAQEDAAVGRELDRFYGPLDEQQKQFDALREKGTDFGRAMDSMWGNVADRASQSMADMLMAGKFSFSTLRDIAIRALTEVLVKMAFINPLINGFMGLFGTSAGLPSLWSSGASAAAGAGTGGGVTAAGGGTFLTRGPTHFTVGDNPGGVELVNVIPLSGIGRSTVRGQALRMAGGGAALVGATAGGGDTFQFNYTFAGGVTRSEVLSLIPRIVEASKAAVLDASRRRRDGFR